MNSEILRIAIPSIVSNITVPLLGLIDVAIVGHMGNTAYIGAIAIGSMIFNVICWVFGFLRMGTSGITSQAYGRGDHTMVANTLLRSLVIGIAIGVIFIIFQPLVRWGAMAMINPQSDIRSYACRYFDICIWGMPAMLGLYGLNGWYIGMQNTKVPMLVSVFQNLANIACSLILVFVLDLKMEGVALGTLTAQYLGFGMSMMWLHKRYARCLALCSFKSVTNAKEEMKNFFTVNRDIFIRTLFLVAVNFMFTAIGAKQGTVILAVNTLMYQFFTFFSYVMDGFAYAAEAVGGKYFGRGDTYNFHKTVKCVFMCGVLICVAYSLLYVVCGSRIIKMLSDETPVIVASREYMPWVWILPLVGMAAFVWDGLYVGITASKGMLLSCVIAAIVFFVVYMSLYSYVHNHALWLAFILFLMTRGLVQTVMWKKITTKLNESTQKI